MQSRSNVASARRRRLVNKLAAYSAGVTTAFGAGRELSAAIVFIDLGPIGTQVNSAFEVDLNDDDVVDVFFQTGVSTSTYCPYDPSAAFCYHYLQHVSHLSAANVNGVRVNSSYNPFLSAGASIQLSDRLTSRALLRARGSVIGGYSGSWGPFDGARGYVGVAFDVAQAGRHTGWLDIEGTSAHDLILHGYAYETEPGKPILAGDTGASSNVPGDTNADGQVNIMDLNNVRNNFGATGNGVLGDTNGDDVVNIEDLNAVRNNFGIGNPVPEPPSLVLLAAGAAGLAVLRRKRAASE